VQGINPGPLETGQTLTVTATSDNAAIFSNPIPVTYSSPATTAQIKLNSNDHATGVTTITVVVKDNGGTANGGVDTFTYKFKVNVKQVNDAPTLMGDGQVPMQFAGLGETIQVPVTVGDVDNAVGSLGLVATSGDEAVIRNGVPPGGDIVVAGAGPSRIISLTVTSTPGAGAFRDVLITYTVSDSGQTENTFDTAAGNALSTTKSFTVRVSNTKPNHRPHISMLETNRVTISDEDVPIVVPDGNIVVDDSGDPSPPPGPNAGDLTKLHITGHSDNQALITDVNIVETGDPNSQNRGVIIIPNKDANGTATVTLTVTDGGDAEGQNKLSGSITIKVNVNPVPDAPFSLLTGSSNITVKEDTDTTEGSNSSDTASNSIEFTTGDAETAPADLRFEVTSSNTALIPIENVKIGPPLGSDGRRRALTIRGAPNRNGGPVTITIRTIDAEGQSAVISASVTISVVNDPPTIDQPANVSFPQVTGDTTRTIQLTNVGPGGGDDELSQTFLVKSATVLEGPAFISIPANPITIGTEKKATLSLIQKQNVFGTSKIRIILQDSGTKDNGGDDDTQVDFFVTIGQVNQAPTISAIPNQIVSQGDPPLVIAFSVQDGPGETPAASLIVTATSDNSGLIPPSAIVTGGSGTDRSLRITPAANQFGTANITVTVTDTGNSTGADVKSSNRTFLLTVNQVQQKPQVSAIPDIVTQVNTESDIISFTVSDQETPAALLALSVAPGLLGSSNPLIIPPQNVQFGGSGGNRLMIIVPATDMSGQSTVTIRVTDADNPTPHFRDVSFKVTVERINTAPTIESLANQTILQGSTAGPLGFRVTDAETAAGLLEVIATSSNQTLVPNQNISLGGQKNDRTITITPLPDQAGVTTITITVKDSGAPPGTPGNVKTASTSFTLNVLGTSNTPPTISDVAGVITEKNKPTGVIPFTVDDAETAKGFLIVTAQSSNTTLIPVANIFFGGAGGNRTVFITPGFDQTGTATITLTVTDGGNLTDSTSFQITVTEPPPPAKAIDFNGDGKPDLLFQDANAFIAFWSMANENLLTAGLFSPNSSGNPDWRIISSGNFNGDGKPDLLFQHANGDLAVWYMNGITLTSPTLLNPANPGAGWKAIGTGDFNGDGKSDILLQHTDRTLAVWYMNGTDLTSPTLVSPANPGAEWAAVAVGDFNSDGNPDIVFEDSLGILAAWYMNGVDLSSGTLLNPPGGDPAWRVVASTDLDGDGNADLIFQNSTDGRVAAWFMNGVDLIRATLLNPASPGGTWQIVGP
jgi:hypothetical protein